MNEKEMIHWVREEAGRSDAEAAMKLAECYMKGEGMEKNEEEALAWFRKAAEQGDEDAKSIQEEIRNRKIIRQEDSGE